MTSSKDLEDFAVNAKDSEIFSTWNHFEHTTDEQFYLILQLENEEYEELTKIASIFTFRTFLLFIHHATQES